jgi:tetratricopeptide (TPR) repeat protein
VKKRDQAEGLARLVALRSRLREAGALSDAARAIEEVVAAGGRRNVPTEAGIVDTLAQDAYNSGDYARAADLADELVALDPDTGVGWQLRANARIFALRHEEAAVACTEAIENLDRIYARGQDEGAIFFGTDPRAGMYFNRSCVECKLGRRDAAIESLRIAVRKDAKYAAEAVADDYMEALFDDAEFQAICAQDPGALRTAEERDPAWVKQLVARARDQQQAGDARAGLETATRAATIAGYLDAPAVLVEALAVLSRMQALTGELDTGLETSARAVELAQAETIPADVRALAYAQRGICLQAGMRLDEAKAAYERALDERRRAFGDAHPSLIKSLVSIVGVALAQERPAPEIEALLARGVDIAQGFFASDPPKDHIWAEAIDDLVSLLVRRSMLRQANGEVATAVAPLALALDRLEEQKAVGYVPMATVVDQIRSFADAIASAAPTPAVSAEAAAVRERAEVILIPGPPVERRVRLVFRRVRAFVDQARAGGVEDERIAGLLADIVRGGDAVPEELRNIEALAALRAVLATAAAREPTVLVTSAMALSMAAMPGELDRAITELEGLVAPIPAGDG